MMTDWLLNKMRDCVASSTATVGSTPTHMSFGSGDAAATGGDTELETETVRKVLERIDSTPDKAIVYYCTLDTTEGNDTHREFGIHDGASGGDMHLRETFPVPYTKTSAVETRMIVSVTFESVTED